MNNITAPLVTIYITNYNYGKYVRKAIESVLEQTFKDFELVIIDDGSTDDSRSIITEYENSPNIRIIFQENQGLNRTNNVALRAARGKYIMRLDADDFLDANALLVMTNIMEENPNLGLVFPDYYYVDDEGKVIGQERRHAFKKSVTLKDQPAHGACTLIRKLSLMGIGGYSEQYRCQDGYDLWLRFVEKHEVDNVNLPLFYYRRHGKNLTDNNKLILETRADIMRLHAESMKMPHLNVVAIFPVRGKCVDPGCQALDMLGEKALIDWTLEEALKASSIGSIIVSTPDPIILKHVNLQYGDTITVCERSKDIARENTTLDATLTEIFEQYPDVANCDAMFNLSYDTPFLSSLYMDKAVNTMRIFGVDSVISVLLEDDLFFHHDGSGLKVVGNGTNIGCLRFERDYLYRKLYGMNLTSMHFFKRERRIVGGQIGHIVVDREVARVIKNSNDLMIANFLLSQKASSVDFI